MTHFWRLVVAILSSGVKSDDPHRRQIVELFDAWHAHHGERPVEASALLEPVPVLVDPQGRGRQHIAARLVQLTGTRAGGFVLTRQEPAGNRVQRATPWSARARHRTIGIGPDAPYALMPDLLSWR